MRTVFMLLISSLLPFCLVSCAGNTSSPDSPGSEADSIINESDDSSAASGDTKIELVINSQVLTAVLENNSSADAFASLLENGPLTLSMNDYGNFEKTGELPEPLVRNDSSITAEPGDIILYQGETITVYYDYNTYNFTRLGKITDITSEELKELLGKNDVTVTFRLKDN